MEQEEQKKIIRSITIPIFFLVLIWGVWALEVTFDWHLNSYGIYPRRLNGLKGILFYPLIHGDFWHIFHNSYSFLVLCTLLFYFYREVAFRVFILIYLFSGIGLWIIGRPSYHIGASGIIYGLAFFIFVSGIIRRHTGLMAVSLIIAFLYGSMVWYLFPIKEGISWEGHSTGAATGVILALIYRKHGPQREETELDDDDEDEDVNLENYTRPEDFEDIKINYDYKKNKTGN